MELDVAPELEGVGEAVGRDRPGLGEVAHDLRIVRGIELEQRRVVRPHRMEERERGLRVAVVVGRLGADREDERAAGLGRLRERVVRRRDSEHGRHSKRVRSSPAIDSCDASFAKSGRARTIVVTIRNLPFCYTLMQAAKCIGSISRNSGTLLLAFVRGHAGSACGTRSPAADRAGSAPRRRAPCGRASRSSSGSGIGTASSSAFV